MSPQSLCRGPERGIQGTVQYICPPRDCVGDQRGGFRGPYSIYVPPESGYGTGEGDSGDRTVYMSPQSLCRGPERGIQGTVQYICPPRDCVGDPRGGFGGPYSIYVPPEAV